MSKSSGIGTLLVSKKLVTSAWFRFCPSILAARISSTLGGVQWDHSRGHLVAWKFSRGGSSPTGA